MYLSVDIKECFSKEGHIAGLYKLSLSISAYNYTIIMTQQVYICDLLPLC